MCPHEQPLCRIFFTKVYLDNRKDHATRALESPIRTAELLLARGVRTVIVTTAATTASANCTLLQVRERWRSLGVDLGGEKTRVGACQRFVFTLFLSQSALLRPASLVLDLGLCFDLRLSRLSACHS